MVLDVVSGVQQGLLASEARRIDHSVAAGCNKTVSSLFKAAQGVVTTSVVNRTLEKSGGQRLPFVASAAIALTPPLLVAAEIFDVVPEELKPIATFIQDNIGEVFYVASIVATVALTILGDGFFSLPALAILATGILDSTGALPTEIRQLIHHVSQPLITMSSLMTGDLLSIAVGGINFIFFAMQLYVQWTGMSERPEFDRGTPLTEATARQILDKAPADDLELNKTHVFFAPQPPVPDVDPEALFAHFEAINWEEHFKTLETKLLGDARFTDHISRGGVVERDAMIEYTRNALKEYVLSIKERRILQGEVSNYQKLLNYLKFITDHVNKSEDAIEKTDILFRLAIEGGEYCGPGRFEVAESIYAGFVHNSSDLSFADKVFVGLQNVRTELFQRMYEYMYNASQQTEQERAFFDLGDRHLYHTVANLYGSNLGLLNSAAENDETAVIDPLSRLMIDWTIGSSVEDFYYVMYNKDAIYSFLRENIGQPHLPKPDLYEYLRAWIEEHIESEERQEELNEQLSEGVFLGHAVEAGGRATIRIIEFILSDLAIVKQHQGAAA